MRKIKHETEVMTVPVQGSRGVASLMFSRRETSTNAA